MPVNSLGRNERRDDRAARAARAAAHAPGGRARPRGTSTVAIATPKHTVLHPTRSDRLFAPADCVSPSIRRSPTRAWLCCSPGAGILLGIDTNLGYAAVSGGSNLLSCCAGGAIGTEVGYRRCGAEFGGCGSRSSGSRAWRTRDAAGGPARWL
eukprot:COSAG02_NODE_9080_length_2338_cov_3.459134_1_plen_153_part_00